jgi:hypothetical protein
MPQIEVVRPFTLTLNNGQQKVYQPGVYEVDDEVANHPYTKHHLREAVEREGGVVRHPHEGETTPLYGPGLQPETPVAPISESQTGVAAAPADQPGTDTGKGDRSRTRTDNATR